jgi:cephalosporin-C deacetylase-like acetyl esterase
VAGAVVVVAVGAVAAVGAAAAAVGPRVGQRVVGVVPYLSKYLS